MAQIIKAASQYAHNYAKIWFSADLQVHSHSCNHLHISSKVSFQRKSTTLAMYKSMYTF